MKVPRERRVLAGLLSRRSRPTSSPSSSSSDISRCDAPRQEPPSPDCRECTPPPIFFPFVYSPCARGSPRGDSRPRSLLSSIPRFFFSGPRVCSSSALSRDSHSPLQLLFLRFPRGCEIEAPLFPVHGQRDRGSLLFVSGPVVTFFYRCRTHPLVFIRLLSA